jgi:hypothetical protein
MKIINFFNGIHKTLTQGYSVNLSKHSIDINNNSTQHCAIKNNLSHTSFKIFLTATHIKTDEINLNNIFHFI